MSTIEKLKNKFFEKPVRNDMTIVLELRELFDEIDSIGGGVND